MSAGEARAGRSAAVGATSAAPHVLDGVTVPLVTPMAPDGRPDAALAEPLLRRLAEAEVDALMLLGSNGEGPLVAVADVEPFVAGVAARWRELRPAGRVLVATSAASTAESLARGRAALAGAAPDALVVSAPIYFHHADREVEAHVRALTELGVAVVVYNIPRYAGRPLTGDLLEQLAALPGVVGVKDSTGDPGQVAYACGLARRADGFAVSQGAEGRLVEGLRQGAAGITPGLANLAPALSVELLRAFRRGDLADATAAQATLARIAGIHQVRPGVVATKTALELLGLCPATAAAPFEPYDADERRALDAVLAPLRDELR